MRDKGIVSAAARDDELQFEVTLRPQRLADFTGQPKLKENLAIAIEAARRRGEALDHVLLYGPPGLGKTTLATIIANRTASHFEILSAVLAGVADIRRVVGEAQERRNLYGQRTILLVDEIHRFNKAQQDALLPHVEDGTIILIGATTENPYFEVIGPLLSRSRVFQFRPLDQKELILLLRRALNDAERGYGKRSVEITEAALDHLADVAGGDVRGALNALELAVESTPPREDGAIHIDLAVAQESIQRRALGYGRAGEEHYDTISAFIKSMRGSDPDAALFWLAKMLYAGEDPEFIARRMVILASEDIGNADPQALVVAVAAAQALQFVGLPEAQLNLAQAATYLATAPKSNAVLAIGEALADVERTGQVEVPDHLKESARDGAALGHGKDYRYPHSFPDHFVVQNYLPETLKDKIYYKPSDQGFEKELGERGKHWREQMGKEDHDK
jgi:putative ATPase